MNISALREYVSYDPETGQFVRVSDVCRGGKKGSNVGRRCPDGYMRFTFKYGRYLAHRVAWAFEHGDPGENEIDHINGIKHDNRISNLRLATRSQNAKNRKISKNSTTGVPGACFSKGRFLTRITVNNKYIHIGYYGTLDEAKCARDQATKQYFGDFARSEPA